MKKKKKVAKTPLCSNNVHSVQLVLRLLIEQSYNHPNKNLVLQCVLFFLSNNKKKRRLSVRTETPNHLAFVLKALTPNIKYCDTGLTSFSLFHIQYINIYILCT
jgi:hypothetical protein